MYEYEEYTYDNPLLDIEATYIIHLIGNGRYESIMEQLKKYPISKKVYILLNKGYKNCKKDPIITKPPLDLIDAYLEIFKHAKTKNNILILEDDFMFDDKILDPYHQKNVNDFIKKDFNIYYIGSIPFVLLPHDLLNYRSIYSLATHSVIYSKNFRDKMTNVKINEIKDWDVYLQGITNRYIYYTPLCYQLFTETENSKHWGDFNYVLFCMGNILIKFFIKILQLDISIDAYHYIYFISKIWIFLILFLILYMTMISVSRTRPIS